MNLSLFSILKANSSVTSLLQSGGILRVYPYGRAPDKTVRPYATYSIFSGVPENYLGHVPDIDRDGTQIDIFADTGASCDACFEVIRDALEPYSHMTGFSTSDLDADTNLYNARLEFDFWEAR